MLKCNNTGCYRYNKKSDRGCAYDDPVLVDICPSFKSGHQDNKINSNTRQKKENKMKFELIDKTKDGLIKAQIGSAVIEVAKQIFDVTPMPDQVKELLGKKGYGDAIIGTLVAELIIRFSDNKKFIAAAECARMVGITRASEEINFIKEIVDKLKVAIAGIDCLEE